MNTRATEEGAPSRKGGRSRREVLAGAAGALAVLGAETLVRATPAQAGTDGDVVLGVDNQSTTGTTGVTASAGYGLHGKTDATGSSGVLGEATSSNSKGVFGIASGSGGTGVSGGGTDYGVSGTGNVAGVIGASVFGNTTADAVRGDALSGGVTGGGGLNGVRGRTNNDSGIGVVGEHQGAGPGVRGTSASGDGVEGYGGGSGIGVYGQGGPSGGNGVQGYAGAAGAAGVFGVNVFGGTGIVGASDAAGGIGIRGEGAAVGIQAQVTGSGVALDVQGPAKFSRSGLVTMPSGSSSVVVPGVVLTAGSLVLATVQQKGGGAYVKSAVPNVAGSSITINLNKAPTVNVKVAWFVVN